MKDFLYMVLPLLTKNEKEELIDMLVKKYPNRITHGFITPLELISLYFPTLPIYIDLKPVVKILTVIRDNARFRVIFAPTTPLLYNGGSDIVNSILNSNCDTRDMVDAITICIEMGYTPTDADFSNAATIGARDLLELIYPYITDIDAITIYDTPLHHALEGTGESFWDDEIDNRIEAIKFLKENGANLYSMSNTEIGKTALEILIEKFGEYDLIDLDLPST